MNLGVLLQIFQGPPNIKNWPCGILQITEGKLHSYKTACLRHEKTGLLFEAEMIGSLHVPNGNSLCLSLPVCHSFSFFACVCLHLSGGQRTTLRSGLSLNHHVGLRDQTQPSCLMKKNLKTS